MKANANPAARQRNHAAALNAFIARKAEFDAMVAELQTMSDDHFSVDPDDVNYGHVGDMAHRVELLKQVTDAYFRRGEFAPETPAPSCDCERCQRVAAKGRELATKGGR